MKRLLILRHGEASWAASNDADRQLTDYGQQQAAAIARWFSQQNYQPLVYASPYLRAHQTAASVCSINTGFACKTLDLLTPSNSVDSLSEFLFQQKAEEVLLVSHQPLVSNLASYLLEGVTGRSIVSFGTACLAVLQSDGLPGCAELTDFVSPEELLAENG